MKGKFRIIWCFDDSISIYIAIKPNNKEIKEEIEESMVRQVGKERIFYKKIENAALQQFRKPSHQPKRHVRATCMFVLNHRIDSNQISRDDYVKLGNLIVPNIF